jgi:hypothetical protein
VFTSTEERQDTDQYSNHQSRGRIKICVHITRAEAGYRSVFPSTEQMENADKCSYHQGRGRIQNSVPINRA